jgi:sugar phosphate isomerase/epimerase
MRLIFGKSKWEMWADPLQTFLQRVKDCGFTATEIYLASLSEPPNQIAALHEHYGLKLIGQVITQGKDRQEHQASFEQQFDLAAQCGAILVNSYAGRDIFCFEDNVAIFEQGIQLGLERGIPVLLETHRGRPTYSAIQTRLYLEALPGLRLTADFSHWMVVHESDLSDQEDTLTLAIERSDHIHARVGYPEGPQVTDPRAPEWQDTLARHLGLWQRIVDLRKAEGKHLMFITPEFGPPGYMHTLPFTNQPVGDVWEINVYMREMLQNAIRL